jgi:glutathione peroxidase
MNAHDFVVKRADGSEMPLSEIKGPVLVVNVASKCGFTPQYEGLEKLNQQYGSKGLTILGFPCNQFGGQEPGDATEIANFCSLTYDVSFPVLGKVNVNGAEADPFFKFLKHAKPGLLGSEAIKWNFTKFLIDADGNVVSRHAPTEKPEALAPEIEKLLG